MTDNKIERWGVGDSSGISFRELLADADAAMLGEAFKLAAGMIANGVEQVEIQPARYVLRGIPIEHAWNCDDTGGTIDLTLRDPTNVTGARWGPAEYFGVEFSSRYLRETIKRRECFGLIDNWDEGWPLLKGIDPTVWARQPVAERPCV